LANSFWQREKRKKKMNNTLLFSRFGKPKNLRKLLAKEEGEEVQEYVQRFCVKDVKDCNQISKCKSRSYFYRLFRSGQWKPLEEL